MSQSMPKSRTGCITCRARKVKCDEAKPACTRCLAAGRVCDGYPSTFRYLAVSTIGPSKAETSAAMVPYQPQVPVLATPAWLPSLEQVQYLARRFVIKPVPAMSLNYETGITYESEACATLGATSEPAVHYALVSMSALRELFEQHGGLFHKLPSVASGVQHGLEQYNRSMQSLVMRMSNRDVAATQASLLCCQLFMTIELAMDDFVAATQHFIRGIQIMHQGRSRPCVGMNGRIMLAQFGNMPSVDVFSIKLFLTPCPDGLTEDFLHLQDQDTGDTTLCPEDLAVKLANMRLAALARATLTLIDGISQLTSTSDPTNLVKDRRMILTELQIWVDDFDVLGQSAQCQSTLWARVGTTFSKFFYCVLRTIVTLALQPPDVQTTSMATQFQRNAGDGAKAHGFEAGGQHGEQEST